MKKLGFTLAEVLITLTIIGVVAALTLPTLMVSVNEQQYRTALKKVVNSLSEAGQMSSVQTGFDYSTVVDTGFDQEGSSLYAVLSRNLNYDPNRSSTTQKSKPATKPLGCAATTSQYNNLDCQSTAAAHVAFQPTCCTATSAAQNEYTLPISPGGSYATLALNDGTALIFDTEQTINSGNAMIVYVDLNGSKGPNLISYCGTPGTKSSLKNSSEMALAKGSGEGECSAGKNFYDQYAVTLSGSSTVTAASRIASYLLGN